MLLLVVFTLSITPLTSFAQTGGTSGGGLQTGGSAGGGLQTGGTSGGGLNTCYNAFGDPYRCGTDPGDSTTNSGSVTIKNPLAADSITEFFLLIIEILLIFAIPLIVLFIIYAGFMMVTAQGNEEQLKTAKRALIYAIIGGLLILGARLILEVIQGTVAALQDPANR